MQASAQTLLQKIHDREAIVAVIGLGYVGLPLAIEFAKAGFPVRGFDLDPKKITAIEAKRSYIKHISDEAIAQLANDRCTCTTDFSELDAADCILICVPTPLTKNREPDVSYIESTGSTIADHMKPHQLIVLESTTYPGTTTEVLCPLLETQTRKAGKDFFLAYSPEREDPGNPKYATSTIPKVVGGLTEEDRTLACALYDTVVTGTIPVSSPDAAEATKLLENIFRSVNIALVNELKVVFDKMDIDIWEVIEAAKSKPFGYMPFYPGPGLGGHCIPIDPFYLTWRAREFNVPTRFIELAGEVNVSMPDYVVHCLFEALNDAERSVKGARILLLGAAYKKNVDDMRESPSLHLITMLKEKGALVDYHDPYVPHLKPMRRYNLGLESIDLTAENIAGYDAVLISTDHDEVDYQLVADHAKLVVDTRNAMKRVANPKARIVKA